MTKGLFVSLTFLLFLSCHISDNGDYTLGLLLPTQREERWVRDKEAMILEAQKAGLELIIFVSNNSASLQMNQARELIEKQVDLIILAPHDAVAASTIVGLAQANSIPLMSYDRLVLNSPVEFYLSFDNIEVGRIQGRYLWDNVGPGNYIILQGSPSDNNASLFYAGAMEVLGPKRDAGDLNILQTVTISDWTPREAFLITQRMLQEHSKIDAVLAPNDGTAAGVIHAIQQLPTAPEITVTGQDAEIRAAQRILEGKQSMTIFKDTRKLAGEAIRIALERLKSGRWPPTDREISNGMTIVPSHFLQPVLVTQDNLQEVLIDSGYIDQEDIMGQP